MVVETNVCRDIGLFAFLVGWHVNAVSLPKDDVILAQLP
jgi:hypothetical protein